MLDFKPIELADKSWIDPLLAQSSYRGSEYTFTNNYNYRKLYGIAVTQMGGYYLLRAERDGERHYFYPAGSGDVKPALEAMIADAADSGGLQMIGVPAEAAAELEVLFPGKFEIELTRDAFDYLYESEKLITLSGKKLHAKRNFINRFQAEHADNWQYEPITPENLPDAREMNDRWCLEMGCHKDPGLQEEACAVRSCFTHFTELGLRGGLLRVDGGVVAYAMGLPVTDDTFIVHIEKAFPSVAGAYPMINQQFAAHNCADYLYVNREDDVGDEGLRKAKLSYKPAILLEKYCARLR